ncbi:MAG: zf-TFIIB domain-containing protein [Candidatus Gastranaerophilaceae bacterium]
MNCPACNSPLVVVEKNGIELDWCPKCNGFWFDADEWRLLGVKKEEFNPFAYEAVRVNEKSRKCPICNKTMEKIFVGDILLDRCPKLHGIWFDKGELGRFVSFSNSKEKTTKTVRFLGEVFNIKVRNKEK